MHSLALIFIFYEYIPLQISCRVGTELTVEQRFSVFAKSENDVIADFTCDM